LELSFRVNSKFDKLKAKSILVTPDEENKKFEHFRRKRRETIGHIEVFQNKKDIPHMYLNAPKGQAIFQSK
jgi:hypothetical protein